MQGIGTLYCDVHGHSTERITSGRRTAHSSQRHLRPKPATSLSPHPLSPLVRLPSPQVHTQHRNPTRGVPRAPCGSRLLANACRLPRDSLTYLSTAQTQDTAPQSSPVIVHYTARRMSPSSPYREMGPLSDDSPRVVFPTTLRFVQSSLFAGVHG